MGMCISIAVKFIKATKTLRMKLTATDEKWLCFSVDILQECITTSTEPDIDIVISDVRDTKTRLCQ